MIIKIKNGKIMHKKGIINYNQYMNNIRKHFIKTYEYKYENKKHLVMASIKKYNCNKPRLFT